MVGNSIARQRAGFQLPNPATAAPVLAAAVAFVILFWAPLRNSAWAWWNEPDAGHGLLLVPLAFFLAYRRGVAPDARTQPLLGIAMILAAVALRYTGGLASEWFTMRVGAFAALMGMVVFWLGLPQLRHWWLPITLLFLSIPLPAVIIGTLAFPLQFKASQMGAALLELRNVPVILDGNVLRLPGHSLFVTEACSGLRSLTALLALGVLTGGLWLRSVPGRILLIALAIPVAILLNGVRVFLTGFLVFLVSPDIGRGFMHVTEGWAIFVVAFSILGLAAYAVRAAERRWMKGKEANATN